MAHRGRDVDESLFGSKRTTSRKNTSAGYSVISKDKLKDLLGTKDTVVLNKDELDRLRNKATIKASATKSVSKEQYSKTLAQRSALRKNKMAKKGKMGTVSAVEKEEPTEQPKKTSSVDKVQKMKDENHDDVKHMNQILLYAECATIRDKQIEEKKELARKKKEEDKKIFHQMELERAKGIRMVEQREKIRMGKRQEDAVMLRKQIAANERERLRQRELAEQEAEQMLQRIKENERRQEEEARRKIEQGRRLHAEVMAANDAAARAKLRKKQEEIEENERIARYLKEKELKEAREEERQARIKAAKEQEVAALRAKQEKANDKQSELDDLRARRYQEAADRRWRLQEKQKALKQQEMLRDMARVRNEQKLYKEKASNEQRKQDQELHLRTLQWQKEQEAREHAEAERKRMERLSIQNTVKSQINYREAQKKKEREEYLAEGRKVKATLAQEKARIEQVKREKLMQMKKMGIPSKYQTELAKKQVLKPKLNP